MGKVAIEYEVVAESKEKPRMRGVLKLICRERAVWIDPPAKRKEEVSQNALLQLNDTSGHRTGIGHMAKDGL